MGKKFYVMMAVLAFATGSMDGCECRLYTRWD